MKNEISPYRGALVAISVIILAGCSTMQQPGANEVAGLTCNKCRSVWVPAMSRGGKPGTYSLDRGSRRMVCPQCESMAETFFRTGRFDHTCPGCGGEVTRCTAQVAGR